MFETIGFQELLLILIIAVIIFGPKKIPEIGKSLGEAIRNFRRSMDSKEKDSAQDDKPQDKILPG
jgi:sec-independent protein translocase protein TatA